MDISSKTRVKLGIMNMRLMGRAGMRRRRQRITKQTFDIFIFFALKTFDIHKKKKKTPSASTLAFYYPINHCHVSRGL